MIPEFQNQYRFLSNFWTCPVEYEGYTYPSSEHAYQAAKSLDPVIQDMIRSAPTAGRAKRLARPPEKGGVVVLRPDWEEVKVKIMTDIVRQKFTTNLDLQSQLLATGDHELVEGNSWHDNFWGSCTCPNCRNKPKYNMLGKILMQIRTELNKGVK